MFILGQVASPPVTPPAGMPPPGGPAGLLPMLMQFWPVLAIVVIMYFLLIAPQRKKEKQRQVMLRALEKNDRVVTIGGIHGLVRNVTDKEVTLLVDEKRDLPLKVSRSAIYAILDRTDASGEGELPLVNPK